MSLLAFVLLARAQDPAAPCPNYNYPDVTFYSKSVEEVKADFPGCQWSKPYEAGAMLKHFVNPSKWYANDMAWMGPYPFLPEGLVYAEEVKCACWTSVDSASMIFHKAADGTTHLMAIEKDFSVRGDTVAAMKEMRAAVDKKAGFAGTAFADQYVSPSGGGGQEAVIIRWSGKTQDLMMSIWEVMPGVGSISTMAVSKPQWALYRAHLEALRKEVQTESTAAGAKAADDL
ncbi:MAG: hypothetical protein Q8P41_29905 [Pseudomonadota bacterium]|nr:hypothetical protein [Pseudomonadota bacterium]